jgi:hypothetical protein
MWPRPWSGSAQSVLPGCRGALNASEDNPDNLFCFHGFGIQMRADAPAKRQIDLGEMERMTMQHDFRFIHARHSLDLFEREPAGIDLFEQPVKSAKKVSDPSYHSPLRRAGRS